MKPRPAWQPHLHRRLAEILPLLAIAFCLCAPASAQQFPLVGRWEGSTSLNGLPVTSDADLYQNGTYRMQAESEAGLSFNIAGTYTVDPAQQMIHFVNHDWQPRDQCLPGLDFQMHCTPLPVPQTTDARYRFLGPDTIVLETPSMNIGPVQFQRLH